MLSKTNSVLQSQIIEFVKQTIKFNNFQYKCIYCNQHITDVDIKNIDILKDIVLWNPIVSHNNLEITKSFNNSIVILEQPTLYVQKISKHNPINENLAINNGFYILYINPDSNDITNEEWKLVVQKDMFLMTKERLINLIKEDTNNIKKEKVIVPDLFEEITDFVKEQINLD